VRELRDAMGFPGMKVLQFSFGPDMGENVDALHHHVENAVAYTGTHDNNTSLGWFLQDAGDAGRRALADYTGLPLEPADVPWAFLRLAAMSVARLAIAPMQDVLGLGSGARMNMPSVASGNWTWRVTREQLAPGLARRLADLARLYGRGRRA